MRNVAGLLAAAALAGCAGPGVIRIEGSFLGDPGEREWEEFLLLKTPERRLDARFQASQNTTEHTLFLRQDDVKQKWAVELNGQKIGELHPMEHPLGLVLPVPAGSLKAGENLLSIVPPKALDDILVDNMLLRGVPVAEFLKDLTVDVEVLDAATGIGLPCRITVSAREGTLVPLTASGHRVAVRPGVVYTVDGRARLTLPVLDDFGTYTVTATRGFEYGMAREDFLPVAGRSRKVRLELRREVPTPGLVACDTHIHTVQYSGHGDATAEERMITLAGEGIELAIATEHNQHTSYEADAVRAGMRRHFTPVTGNEVTTRKGHFNVFPVTPGGPAPNAREEHWPALMDTIRAAGARIIILNHPRDLHSGFRPFDPANFDPVTGENKRGFEFSFDAVEVINSGALQSDLMQLYRDWFALLNYGYRVAAVGGSDSHDVARYIVGQGRTYVECNDHDPSDIDVGHAVRAIQEGRVHVSLGLLTRLEVRDGKATVTVLGPSWTEADRVEIFVNGKLAAEASFKSMNDVQKFWGTWALPKGLNDVWVVAVASGPGVRHPAWAIPKPYQPTSKKWTPRVLGSSPAVRVDRDGDGKYTSPREYAKAIVERVGKDPERLREALKEYDEAVAAQAASLVR